MLPKTKKMLEASIQERRETLREISMKGASIAGDGDGWHSTGYRLQQLQKEIAIRYMQLVDHKSGKIELLAKPKQNDHVEVGHMVKVNLMDDSEAINAGVPFSLVHILTKDDADFLGELYDNVTEMVVSEESPLAKAIVGLKRGDQSVYLQKLKLRILNVEDAIQVSNLFDEL